MTVSADSVSDEACIVIHRELSFLCMLTGQKRQRGSWDLGGVGVGVSYKGTDPVHRAPPS